MAWHGKTPPPKLTSGRGVEEASVGTLVLVSVPGGWEVVGVTVLGRRAITIVIGAWVWMRFKLATMGPVHGTKPIIENKTHKQPIDRERAGRALITGNLGSQIIRRNQYSIVSILRPEER